MRNEPYYRPDLTGKGAHTVAHSWTRITAGINTAIQKHYRHSIQIGHCDESTFPKNERIAQWNRLKADYNANIWRPLQPNLYSKPGQWAVGR